MDPTYFTMRKQHLRKYLQKLSMRKVYAIGPHMLSAEIKRNEVILLDELITPYGFHLPKESKL